MTSIITIILGSTVGLLLNKARDSVANKLKDGGLTDQQLREIIVRDLSDIKTKLYCLSLKDLDSSYSFLKEGVSLLNHALDKSSNDEKSSEGQAEATRISKDSISGILNAALPLPEAIQRLKISSEERFVSAKDCFKASRERATDAFNNKSLSIKDRIMACKLRVAARILETGLQDPEAATTACLLSLEELHGLPAIQDMFSVYLNGGLRSMIKKAERLENIMSVLFINDSLFDFAARYSSQYPNVFTWQGIELADCTLNPILNAAEILSKTRNCEEFIQQLNRTDDKISLQPNYSVFNSRGEIIEPCEDGFAVLYPTGERKIVAFPLDYNNNRKSLPVVGFDSDDNVYAVFITFPDIDLIHPTICTLYVFDANYNVKYYHILDFFTKTVTDVKIAVDKNKNIMIRENGSQVYVCNDRGELKFKFKLDSHGVSSLNIPGKNDIMISPHDHHAVNLYTERGTLKSTIKVPESHDIRRVAFHYGICKIIVLTYVKKQASWFLLCYSETGDLENSVSVSLDKRHKSEKTCQMIASQSCGLFVVQLYKRIIFI